MKISQIFQSLLIFSAFFAISLSFSIADKDIGFAQRGPSDLLRKNNDFSHLSNEHKPEPIASQKSISSALGVKSISNTTFLDNHLYGNMMILGDFALIPQSTENHPTLKRLCLSTMKYDTIEYSE